MEPPHAIVTHCCLQATKALLSTLKVNNFIRSRYLNHSLEQKYEVLCYHTEVHLLSRGQVSKRWTKVRSFTFLREKENPLSVHFERKDFIYGLAYLADILTI
jgi:hypothetical protein